MISLIQKAIFSMLQIQRKSAVVLFFPLFLTLMDYPVCSANAVRKCFLQVRVNKNTQLGPKDYILVRV